MKKILSLLIFITTLLAFGLAVDKMWYREDDLGQIINGIIRSKEDAVKVFSADEREFIVPINFKRSKANFISGFLRPLKHVFFTVIYAFWGLNVKAFFWFHVAIHALNACLFFLLLGLFLPLWLSTLGGLLFAFYPDNSWLAWIAATHNSLSTLFLLLTLLMYYPYFFNPTSQRRKYLMLTLSGCLYLLSLLSRENGVFFPFWLFAGVWLYYRHHMHSIWQATKSACTHTWIFFTVNVLYVLIRFWAFGISTLDRTLYNLSLRVPMLTHYLPAHWFAQTIGAPSATVIASPAVPLPAHAEPTLTLSFTEKIIAVVTKKGTALIESFFSWSSIMFCLRNQTTMDKVIIAVWWMLLTILCWQAYKHCYRLLLFLIIGFYCFSWQAFVAYPAARYINSAYPIIIALVVIGLDRLKQCPPLRKNVMHTAVMLCVCHALITGAYNNITTLRGSAAGMMSFKERYAQFFNEHTFPKGANFVLLGSPFVSDIQNIFQYFMNDLSVSLAHELFSTVAEQGYFGCRSPFRSSGVASTIEPIPGGFRFISLDEQHCAWWMHFSDHPVRWVAQDKAYRWSAQPYQVGVWHDCSIGKFMIERAFDSKANLDVSFIIDKKWLNPNTVMVSWDTRAGKYITLDTSHLH